MALAGAPCRESRWDRWLGLATGSTGPAQIRPPLARGDFSGSGRCEPGCHSYGYKRAHGREELRGAGGGGAVEGVDERGRPKRRPPCPCRLASHEFQIP